MPSFRRDGDQRPAKHEQPRAKDQGGHDPAGLAAYRVNVPDRDKHEGSKCCDNGQAQPKLQPVDAPLECEQNSKNSHNLDWKLRVSIAAGFPRLNLHDLSTVDLFFQGRAVLEIANGTTAYSLFSVSSVASC